MLRIERDNKIIFNIRNIYMGILNICKEQAHIYCIAWINMFCFKDTLREEVMIKENSD